MANIKQQIKRNKTNIKRQQLNKSFKSSTKTAIKKVEASVLAGNYEEAVLNLNFANKKLDKGLAKGIYHRNFVANHKSKFDPGFVTQAIHRPHGYAVKSDLKEYPITKQIVESMRSFYIFREDNRKTLKSLLYGIKMAEQGFAYVIFPEGGTMYRDQDKITEVRPGSFKIAERAQTDILPVSIIGSNFRKRKRCIFKPTLVTVVIHEVIPYEENKDLTTNEISDKVIEVINSVL